SGLIEKLALSGPDRYAPLSEVFGPGIITTNPLIAARLLKGRLLLVDALGSAWVVRSEDSAISVAQVLPERSDAGTVIWRSADVLWPAPCPLPGADIKTLLQSQP